MQSGQGAVEATPIQLARIIGGIANGGHLLRPHTVFPDQLPEDFRKAIADTFPGSGNVDIPIDPQNWTTITDGMAAVTQPGASIPRARLILKASTSPGKQAPRSL